MPHNRLSRETSPYLLQHQENPVEWYPWGDEAFAEARRRNVPVLLSIGYAACHWCHVMAHESFENPKTAELMNRLFINIKVDREERPDIDTIYMSALHLLGEQGGWPLTMFLTDAAEPFWGGTYFPPTPRYGRPSFSDVLLTISEVYAKDRARVTANVTSLTEALSKLGPKPSAGDVPVGVLDAIADRLLKEVDLRHGGIGGAPKFPQPSIFELLWRSWLRTGKDAMRHAVTLTLDKMCAGGIYDHLGGGFARYATDDAWLVPHFEKMLYDNAQLVSLLTTAWQQTRDPVYRQRVIETVEWVLRDMTAEGSAFASSFDADSEGEEGKFYVWTEGEIDQLLGPASAVFKHAYDVSPSGNWEGHTILNWTSSMGDDSLRESDLAASREILLAARAQRVPPGRDDKILADWNGLMLSALVDAGMTFDRPDWIAAAERAFRFIATDLVEEGRLLHAYRQGRARHPATLDDYANMAKAGIALFEATGVRMYLATAIAWVETLDRYYWDDENAAYYLTAIDTPGLLVRTMNASDNATPSGNGTMVHVLARLAFLTGRERFREHAEALITRFSGEVQRNFFPLSTLLNGVDLLNNGVQIVVIGTRGEAEADALLREAYQHSVPNRILQFVEQSESLGPDHPASGKTRINGKAAAYICRGPVCSAPVTAAEDLAKALSAG